MRTLAWPLRRRCRRGYLLVFTLSAAIWPWGPAEAVANPPKSRLTAVDLKICKRIAIQKQGGHKDGGAWRCPGLPGYPVYFAEGDLRQMLAFGSDGERRRSASQTLGPFNTIFEGKVRPTIEWRVAPDAKGQDRPYATIVRYHISRDGEKGEALVITKVNTEVSCQLAVVDATANENAIAVAREWADANARALPCPQEPVVLGRSGKGPL